MISEMASSSCADNLPPETSAAEASENNLQVAPLVAVVPNLLVFLCNSKDRVLILVIKSFIYLYVMQNVHSHSLFSIKLHSLEVLLPSRFGGRRRPNPQPMNLKQAAILIEKWMLFVPCGQKLNPTSRFILI